MAVDFVLVGYVLSEPSPRGTKKSEVIWLLQVDCIPIGDSGIIKVRKRKSEGVNLLGIGGSRV